MPDPEPPSTTRRQTRRERRPARRRRSEDVQVKIDSVFSTDTSELAATPGSSFSDLISSRYEQVRLETAQAILRQGWLGYVPTEPLQPPALHSA